jgi:hypothetical protein
MKKLILAIALATSACTANQVLQSAPIIGNVCTVAEGTLIDEKVIYAAEALYNVPAHAYVTAIDNGQLPEGELRTNVKGKLITMFRLLSAVRAAKGTVNCDYNSMKELHREVLAIIPRK